MGKKKKSSALDTMLAGIKFHNPSLQAAYEEIFSGPLEAPIRVEYDDYTPDGNLRGTPLKTRVDPYEQARGEAMVKAQYGWKSGPGALFPFNASSYTPPKSKRNLNRTGGESDAAAAGRAARRRAGKETAKDMQATLGRENARIKALGGHPVGQEKHGTSIWGHISDWLSRGQYASAGATRAAIHGDNPLSAAIAGARGKKKLSYADILHEAKIGEKVSGGLESLFTGTSLTQAGLNGKSRFTPKKQSIGNALIHKTAQAAGRVAESGGGLIGDIGLDPTTYLGLGLVGDTAKAGQKTANALRHVQKGSEIISRGGKATHELDTVTKELVTGARHVKRGVKVTEEARIYRPIQEMKKSIQHVRTQELKKELRLSPEWAGVADRAASVSVERKALRDSLRTSPEWAAKFDRATSATQIKKLNTELNAAVKAHIPSDAKKISGLHKLATERAAEEATQWEAQALKNYQEIVQQKISRGIGVGLAGTHGKKITVVPAPVLDATLGRIGQIEPVAKGLESFQKTFVAGAGVQPEIHQLRQQATNAGFTRAEFLMQRLSGIGRQLHRDEQVSTWEDALGGTPHSGQTINVDGKDIDAAEFWNNEIAHLQHGISGTTSGNVPISKKELASMMPPRFKGTWVTDKAGNVDVRKSLQDWETKSGPQALWTAQQAFERAVTRRSIFTSAADALGVRSIGDSALPGATKIVADLKNRGWVELDKKLTHGLMEGVLFDKETAHGITTIMKLMENEREWGKWTRYFARVTAPIKWTLTQPNPGFHIRNAIGDSFINEIDKVRSADYAQAYRVLAGATEKYGGQNPLIMAEGDILEQAFKLKDQTTLFHTRIPVKKPGGLKHTAVTDSEIYAGMNKYGITQNYARVEFGNESFGSRIAHSRPVNTINKASEFRENYFRAAHFIKLVKQNPTGLHTLDEVMAYAAGRVRKMHFDYTDFTRFEKQYASNVIPFYKWTRKAIPLMTELMFTNPGKVIAPNKAQLAMSRFLGNEDPNANDPFPDAQGLIPKWMVDAGYTPGGMLGGNHAMFALPNPFQDVVTNTIQPVAQGFSTSPKAALNSILQQSNPLLKDPYELVQNENTFMSNEERVPVYKSDSKKKDLANYFMNQIPYAHQISRAQNPDAEKANLGGLVSQLSGIYTQELTPSMQRGEMFRQNRVAQQKYSSLKKQIVKDLKAAGWPDSKIPQTTGDWENFLEAYTNGQYQKPKRG